MNARAGYSERDRRFVLIEARENFGSLCPRHAGGPHSLQRQGSRDGSDLSVPHS